MSDLPVTTTERGFDHHAAVPSEYGGEVRVSESSNAEYPGVWLHAACPEKLSNRKVALGGDLPGPEMLVEASANLTAANAWRLGRQLAATVVNHYQGDARPADAVTAARDAVVLMTGWSPQMAAALLHRLRHAGFVLVNIGADPPPAAAADLGEPAVLADEPEDKAVVALLVNGEPDEVYMRDDQVADDESDDAHWCKLGADFAADDDDAYATWAELNECGLPIVRLYTGEQLPPGVRAYRQWGVRSDDGTVYEVSGHGHDTAVREATLLRNGVPGDPERTGEPGATPASRYVMETPKGTVHTGWSWPLDWTPPPTSLLGE